jgi:uncharacterized repeat protein (TIGR01451 family)
METGPAARSTTVQATVGRRFVAALGAFAIVAATALATASQPVAAYESATTPWSGGSVTVPSGLTISATGSGLTTVGALGTTQALASATPSMFTPNISASTPAFQLNVDGTGCPVTGSCANRGTLTVAFTQPVTNPVFHLSGIGGVSGSGANVSRFGANFLLSGSVPAGATLGTVSGGKVNLQVIGTSISRPTAFGSTDCLALTDTGGTASAVAGCGSVPVAGTVTSVTFSLSLDWASTGTGSVASPIDAVAVSVTLGQDYGDAPASYDGAQAPAHVIGDLRLGAIVDEDLQAFANSVVSPFSQTGTAVNDFGDNASGPDEDAISLPWPTLTTKMIATHHVVTVPIAGASRPGEVCGYIDFAHLGSFTAAADKTCTSFAANATSVVLDWIVPATMTAGTTYARLRTAYGTAPTQASSPTGLASSGEVEDYEIYILPTVTVNKIIPNGAVGTFDLSVNGRSLAVGTFVNGFTTGAKTLGVTTPTLTTPDLPGTPDATTSAIPLSIVESPSGGNIFAYTQAYTCVDGTGATVQSGTTRATAPGLAIPASGLANGLAQNITCTFTNAGVPSLTLLKTANPTTITNFGQTVTYSFFVINTGPLTLSGLTIADTFTTGGSGTVGPITCPLTTLIPLASTTCSGTYVASPADIDLGVIRNTAIATGVPPGGPPVNSNPSSAVVTAVQTPGITILKTANRSTVTAVGDPVVYSFVVTNTGNVTLTNITVNDTFTPPGGPPLTISCPATTLTAAGTGATSSMTCVANYVASAADFNFGQIKNTATATGTPPVGPPITSPPSTVIITATQLPALTIVKASNVPSVATIGDPISYTFVVTNTGNVTLTAVSVADVFVAPAGPPLVITCPVTTLTAAGTGATSTMICSAAPYISTIADFDKGSIVNTATASGTPPVGPPITSPPSTVTVLAAQLPSITIVKTANVSSITIVGYPIGYSFLVTNTGNVTLSGVTITDVFVAPAGPPLAISCPSTVLTPAGTGATSSMICMAIYTSTGADFFAGSITNTATATGTPPTGPPVTSPPSTVVITIPLPPPILPPTGLASLQQGLFGGFGSVVIGCGLVIVARSRTRRRRPV